MNVDNVSELIRDNWKAVFEMELLEFLNLICYNIDKQNEQKRQLEEYKRRLK